MALESVADRQGRHGEGIVKIGKRTPEKRNDGISAMTTASSMAASAIVIVVGFVWFAVPLRGNLGILLFTGIV